GKNRQRRGSRYGETPVRAANPSGSFNDISSENFWFTEHLQRNARTDNIHDGIHRADFVKMHFVRRHSMDFSFSNRDALKNCDGFFLHPIRKRAVANQRFDLRKIFTVFMLIVMMFMVMVMFVA